MTTEWTNPDHVLGYLSRADSLPHRAEAEAALLDEIPPSNRRVLDLGTGDGRLLDLVLRHCPGAEGVGVDLTEIMLERFRQRFAGRPSVQSLQHDLSDPLPDLGAFDAVVSSLAIHHLVHERKRELYGEIFERLTPGGVFCNLEHVSSPGEYRHQQFMAAMGIDPENQDPTNRTLDVETQLRWLREIGFADVDCLWKWREVALMAGLKPS
jgi:tRNA (cmo5U34)-methyltransferase